MLQPKGSSCTNNTGRTPEKRKPSLRTPPSHSKVSAIQGGPRNRVKLPLGIEAPLIHAVPRQKNAVNHNYRDYSQVPPQLTAATPLGDDENNLGDDVNRLSFGQKLHHILAQEEYNNIIFWNPHGRSFQVKVPKVFEVHICEKYFGHKRYSTFLRQLTEHDFNIITQGPERNSQYHECFLRGLPHLCVYLPSPRHPRRLRSDPQHEPDFAKLSLRYPLPAVSSEVSTSSLSASGSLSPLTFSQANDTVNSAGGHLQPCTTRTLVDDWKFLDTRTGRKGADYENLYSQVHSCCSEHTRSGDEEEEAILSLSAEGQESEGLEPPAKRRVITESRSTQPALALPTTACTESVSAQEEAPPGEECFDVKAFICVQREAALQSLAYLSLPLSRSPSHGSTQQPIALGENEGRATGSIPTALLSMIYPAYTSQVEVAMAQQPQLAGSAAPSTLLPGVPQEELVALLVIKILQDMLMAASQSR